MKWGILSGLVFYAFYLLGFLGQHDLVNGLFEGLGAIFVWRNWYQLHKDQEVKGVYWPVTGFYFLWGVWNCFYYPALGQTFSFYAGVVLCLGNLAWLVTYLRLPPKEEPEIEIQVNHIQVVPGSPDALAWAYALVEADLRGIDPEGFLHVYLRTPDCSPCCEPFARVGETRDSFCSEATTLLEAVTKAKSSV